MLKKSIRTLGIDPGTSLLGYGIIDQVGNKYQAVTYGTCRTAPRLVNAQRVKTIYQHFLELIKQYQPDQIALEKLFFFKNEKTVMAVSEVRGVLLLVAAEQNIPVREFTPLQVKQAVSGYGRAEKSSVQKMVQLILGLAVVPKPDDVADALAIAICCANTIVYEN